MESDRGKRKRERERERETEEQRGAELNLKMIGKI